MVITEPMPMHSRMKRKEKSELLRSFINPECIFTVNNKLLIGRMKFYSFETEVGNSVNFITEILSEINRTEADKSVIALYLFCEPVV